MSNPESVTPVPAVQYVISGLNAASQNDEVNPEAARLIIQAITAIADDNTVYPSVTTEGDDSLTMYWIGGNRSVEFNVEPDGTYYLTATVDGSVISDYGGSGELPLDMLQMEVDKFSKYVFSENPRWRDLFSSFR